MRGSKIVAFTQYNVETVVDNAEGYTLFQLHFARAVRCLQCMTAHPSDADLSALVGCNMLKNCPIFGPDIALTKLIYGPTIAGFSRGNGVQRSPRPTISNYVVVTPQIDELNQVLDISTNVMFINGLPFFLT